MKLFFILEFFDPVSCPLDCIKIQTTNAVGKKNHFISIPRPVVHDITVLQIWLNTPTYSSWLNQVEIWFNIITQQAIRRGIFRSVRNLVSKIDEFVDAYNAKSPIGICFSLPGDDTCAAPCFLA